MFRIRRFSVVRTANVVALLYLVVFAILIVPFGLFLLAARAAPSGAVAALVAGAIGLLLFYAVIGWVFTAIACLIYNFVARFAGGIEIEVERVGPAAPSAGYPYGSPYGQVTGQGPWGSPPGPQPPGYGPSEPPTADRR